MFIQVIQGRVIDTDDLLAQLERWMTELRPGAVGWLGSTAGVTDDGEAVILARFESAAAARANSERPEQGEWWSQTVGCFDGEPRFTEGEDVEQTMDGGSDDAGFVQVMQGRVKDRQELVQQEAEVEERLRSIHTGLIGSVRLWQDDGRFLEAIYFRDEAAARAGEKAMGEDEELAARLGEWQSGFESVEFLDLRSPVLTSA
jgi:hypothetical protein